MIALWFTSKQISLNFHHKSGIVSKRISLKRHSEARHIWVTDAKKKINTLDEPFNLNWGLDRTVFEKTLWIMMLISYSVFWRMGGQCHKHFTCHVEWRMKACFFYEEQPAQLTLAQPKQPTSWSKPVSARNQQQKQLWFLLSLSSDATPVLTSTLEFTPSLAHLKWHQPLWLALFM